MNNLVERVAKAISNSVHDTPWETLTANSPITAELELRRAKAALAAMQSDDVRLRERLRELRISPSNYWGAQHLMCCMECDSSWSKSSDETHAPGCLCAQPPKPEV